MTDPELIRREQCEAAHGTGHLPEDVRATVFTTARSYNPTPYDSVVIEVYEDIAEVALGAYKAGRASVAARLREWANGMDHPNWREGWTDAIAAARTFAQQIEDGSL